MSLNDDLTTEVKKTLADLWTEETTTTVPDAEDLRLNANHAKNLEVATVLYADLDGSTSMVDNYKWHFSAEVYKTYLRCAAAVIKSESGTVTAYDGDRIMAIFTGDFKNTRAVRTALKINYAVHNIIRPAISAQYTSAAFTLNHVVGVDSTQLRTARIGVKGDNDLVWIGRAANYAAKLTTLSEKPIWITKAVYDKMNKEVKYSQGTNMWQERQWASMGNLAIYCSTYTWRID